MNEISPTHLTTGVTSPFLPGTKIQVAWDSTSLKAFKTCPRMYQYSILDGYQGRFESVHLRFGTEYHAALEHYDHRMAEGLDREAAIRSMVRSVRERTADWVVDESIRAGRYKNPRTLMQLVVDYCDHFDPDPAETYIKADGQPAVELSFRIEMDWGPEAGEYRSDDAELDRALTLDAAILQGYGQDTGPTMQRQPYILCGHLDRVASFHGDLYILDKKTTTTTLSAHYFDGFNPDTQMTLYTLAGKIILGVPIRGVIIDGAQIMLESPNAFARGFTMRTEDQIQEWLKELRDTLTLAEIYATRGHFPMNDTACGNYGGCKYRDVCSKSPSVRDRFLKTDFIQLEPDARWNPLRSR